MLVRSSARLRRTFVCFVVLAICFGMPAFAQATTYYVSPTGSDSHAGTAFDSAWRTVTKVNRFRLHPGDTVLFEGGKAFWGTLAPRRSGSSVSPITFSSYGTGQATISNGAHFRGASHLTLSALRFGRSVRGSGQNIRLTGDLVTPPPGNKSAGIDVRGRNWAITGNTIRGTGGSGLILTGSRYLVEDNVITNTGASTAVAGQKNGITVCANDTSIKGNVIQNFWSNGIWVGSHSSTITDNYITDAHGYTTARSTDGIAWRQNDGVAGTTTIRRNTIAGTTGSDISVARGSQRVKEDFVIAWNSLLRFSGSPLRIAATIGRCQCSQTLNPVLGISSGKTYYVAASGSDRNSGTTPTAPWKTIGQVNSPDVNHPGVELKPGDVVLFRALDKFQDATLTPPSGASNEPILYGSYGPGKAVVSPASSSDGVWLSGVHDIVVQDLVFDGSSSPSADGGIYSHDENPLCSDHLCSYDIVIKGCTIRHFYNGVRAGAADHDWTVEANDISDMEDNGILFDRAGVGPYYGGTRLNALFNSISDTGFHPPDHPHAIYDDSSSSLVFGNRIARFGDGKIPSSGISIRFTRSIVENNTIDGGGIQQTNGIDLYDYDSGVGCTKHPCQALWAYNRISHVTGSGIYVDYHYGPNVCGSSCPPQAFTIANNTIIMAASRSDRYFDESSTIDFEYLEGSLTLANNIGTGTAAYDLGIEDDHRKCRVPGRVSVVENNNDWSNTLPNVWKYCRSLYTGLSNYQKGTNLGAHDLSLLPQVHTATFELAPTSPAIGAGTASVPGAPPYKRVCPPTLFGYCGSAPDLGAVPFGAGGGGLG